MTSTLSSSPLIQKPNTQSSRLSLRIVEQLKGLTFFLMRPLRKKAVLILILVASILYCIVSVTQFHLFAKINKKSEDRTKEHIVDSISDNALEHHVHSASITIVPNIHDEEFAFLKRQHNLRENLDGKANKLSKTSENLYSSHSMEFKNVTKYSTSDVLAVSASNGIKCRNSVQGKYMIVDDRGYVCPIKLVGINGCCHTLFTSTKDVSNNLYSCKSCNSVGCCSIYEYCISCCMAPSNRELLNRLVTEQKSPVFKIFMASITDYFELCLTKCRTSSASVQHENTYRNPLAKYCYSDYVFDYVDNDHK